MATSTQISVRFPGPLGDRIQKLAETTARTPPQIVIACAEAFLPVIEAGIFGSPAWPELKAVWDADVQEVREQISAVRPGRRHQGKTRKAA